MEPINRYLLAVRVPSEFSRRTRDISERLKAEEYRNIVLYFFPMILEALADSTGRKIWLRLALLARTYYADDREMERIPSARRIENNVAILPLMDKAFGGISLPYNAHVLFVHAERIRAHGPYATQSAVVYEASYAFIRDSLRGGGTRSLDCRFKST